MIMYEYTFIKDAKIFKREPSVNIQLCLFFLIACIGLHFVFILKGEDSKNILLYFSIPLILLIIIELVKRYKKGYIQYVFDREKQTIHYPKSINNDKEKTYNFKNLSFDFKTKEVFENREDGQHYVVYNLLGHKEEKSFEDDWNYYIWYMDKNRPLPLNREFDRFRQADYERRKVAGFPKPLYPSNIKTPEATKEQRAERKRIGGW